MEKITRPEDLQGELLNYIILLETLDGGEGTIDRAEHVADHWAQDYQDSNDNNGY
jgi:hypothetical protein